MTNSKWWVRKLGEGPWSVEVVVFHDQPHFEEIAAFVMAKIWGRHVFPGIENARVEFQTNGCLPEEFTGLSADQILIQKKYLAIGIGRGLLDEHGVDSPSSAHLMAEILEVDQKPELKLLLNFCKRVDFEGKSMPLDPHSWLNDRWDNCENDEGLTDVFDWAVDGIHDFLAGQIKFQQCENDFLRTGRIIEGPIRIAIVKSDIRKMNKWIRWKFGKKIDFIIQRKSSGNTIIFSTPSTKVNFTDVVRIVRMQELRKRRFLIPMWYKLEVEGDCPQCPPWYYSKMVMSQLLNGSKSTSDIEPTVLTLRELAGCIILAASRLSKKCEEKICLKSGCESYRIGLLVCRDKQRNNGSLKQRDIKIISE
ncbi:MAG: hypothetical protein A2Y98_03865 [Candidatus Portnoybacteria bacterium RBG_19FT_COMBO_36_7]|uniref:Uncharacterized protein n=1 Tax=Candidatus Portnoybacteria bacterium RBG_19FT_COMBO_36_7 TaxID=1801992 RepID=A0A1G2F966_9BACT|nr:MAG: hypothetical protein A2Y98_03865 [Candidatus Portnoybacteria bacterium RBG_19FT_COMBO_36_7]